MNAVKGADWIIGVE